ncbi:ParA family protein [Burkholderia cepacia]|uniref:ParA family protein n=1 Tax=Burkholderia cepacia TaxID=292 RepID=UPI000A72F379|nr:ParA family protein [Burkholderia cepacia]
MSGKPQPEKLAPVIATINMKGGVGKTTITANVFRLLYYRLKKRVLLIDFDPQFNLTQTVVAESRYGKLREIKKTIMSVMEPATSPSLYMVSNGPLPPPAPKDVTINLRFINDSPYVLDLIPGDFGLVKYSLIHDEAVLGPIRERFLKFIEQCRREYDLVCIDCNPSSSFMTLCAIRSATHFLVPVKPDRYSILGLELLDEFIVKYSGLAKPPEMIVVLNGIPTKNYDQTVENALRSSDRFGTKTLSNHLKISRLLEATPNYTGFATDKKVKNKKIVTTRIANLVDELGQALGLV